MKDELNVPIEARLLGMGLHQTERYHGASEFTVLRVVGGWIYRFHQPKSICFVPVQFEEIKVGDLSIKSFPGTHVQECGEKGETSY